MGSGYFSAGASGPRMHLPPDALAVLRSIVAELHDVIDDEHQRPAATDPLEQLVGLSGPTEAPSDARLARLFPDAYRDDPEAASDFRRYTEPGLRDGKRAAIATVLADLGQEGQYVQVDDDRAQSWLSVLTDLRLLLSAQLGIETDADTDRLAADMEGRPPDDPALAVWTLYSWLGELQASLIEALSSSG